MAIIMCLVENSIVEALFIPDVFPFMVKLSIKSSLKRGFNSHPLFLHQNSLSGRYCIPGLIVKIIKLLLPLMLILAIEYLQNTLKAIIYLRYACFSRIRFPKLRVMFSFTSLYMVSLKVCDFSPILGVTTIVASHEVHDRRH